MTAGTPPLNYFWKNVKTGQVTTEKRLTIINIRVENTDALQTIVVEMNQQGCSLMCIVRNYIMFSLGMVMFVMQC